MADAVPFTDPSMSAATSLPPALTSTLPTDDTKTKATEQKLESIEKEEEAASEKEAGGISGLSKRYEDMLANMVKQQGVEMNDLKPWNANEELAKRQPNLWEEFGSPAFIVAMLGSAFAARPMNAALQSGGAAIQAANQGAEDSYNKAFQAWKDNTDLAIKRVNMEHTEFSEIQDLYKNDLEAFQAAMRAHLAKFGHERALAMMDMGYFPQVVEAQSKMADTALQLEKSRDDLLKRKLATDMVKQDPDYQSGDPQRMLEAINRADAAIAGENVKLTPDQSFTLQWHQEHPKGSAEDFATAYGKFKSGQFAGRTLSGKLQTDVQNRQDAWDASHPDATDDERNAAHDKIMRDVVLSSKPTQDFNAQEKARHDQVMENLSSGRLDATKAKQDETDRHNKAMEDIANGKLQGQTTKQEEVDRHNLAMEDIFKARLKQQADATGEKNHSNPKWLASPEGQKWIKTQPESEWPQYQAYIREYGGGTDPKTVAETVDMIGQYKLAPLTGWVLKGPFGQDVQAGLHEKYPNYDAKKWWAGISAARAVGTRGGQIETSAVEADRTFALADKASAAFPRGGFVPFNKLRQMGARALSNPQYRQFMDANEAAITAYGATMSRSGVNTVTAQNRATNVLDTADSPETYKAGIKQLQMEVDAVRNAPADALDEVIGSIFGNAASSGSTSTGVKWSVSP